jgi:hypothetical protein
MLYLLCGSKLMLAAKTSRNFVQAITAASFGEVAMSGMLALCVHVVF